MNPHPTLPMKKAIIEKFENKIRILSLSLFLFASDISFQNGLITAEVNKSIIVENLSDILKNPAPLHHQNFEASIYQKKQ